jgi:hypothetical protein
MYGGCKCTCGTLGGTADTDIGLLGLPGRVGALTEGVDGGGGSTESVLSGDAAPISLILGSLDHGIGGEKSVSRQLKISGEPEP